MGGLVPEGSRFGRLCLPQYPAIIIFGDKKEKEKIKLLIAAALGIILYGKTTLQLRRNTVFPQNP